MQMMPSELIPKPFPRQAEREEQERQAAARRDAIRDRDNADRWARSEKMKPAQKTTLAGALASQPDLRAWGDGLAAIVEWVMPQRRLFELFENNQATLSALAEASMDTEAHQAFHESIDAVFANEATPLADRVRMAGSVGVITSVFGGPAGRAFWHVPAEELKPLLMAAINDVLEIG